jgi:hypothetical protein
MQISTTAEASLQQSLQKAFPSVPADQLNVSWYDISNCRFCPDGTVGGSDQTVYPTRNDLELLGYKPNPIVNVSALSGKVSKKFTQMIPIWMDRIMPAELAVVVIFVLLVLIFGVLVYSAYRWSRGATKRATIAHNTELEKLEDADPYRGTAFPSWHDPTRKIRQYIEAQERAGYSMDKYRKQYNLPPRA